METDSSLKLKSLFHASFTRTRDRFQNFFIVFLLSWLLIVMLFLLSAALYGLLLVLPWGPVIVIRMPIFIGLAIIFLLTFFYLISWTSIALAQTVINPKRIRAVASFKQALPLVKGYLWFLTTFSVFMLAIFPLGILSLFIALLLWCFWSSFTVFVYLDKRKKGLENLWESKNIIDQKFWPVAGRLFLILIASIAVSIVLQILAGEPGRLDVYFILMLIATIIVQLFVQAFQISFSYEIYKRLPKPSTIKSSENWVWFGLASWVIIVILAVIYFTSVFKNIPV